MTWTINNEIRPLRRGDVQTAMDILEGGSVAAPVYLGTLDIARNTNEIAAHLGFPLVNQVGHNETAWTYNGSTEKFATYMVQPPGIRMNSSGYTVLRIDVTATCTSASFTVRGVTAVETGTASSATLTGNTATCYVQIQPGIDMTSEDGSGDTLRLLELDYALSGAGDFRPLRIVVTPAWSSESYASDAAAFETDTIFPQDDEAWSVDAPLNVHSVRELVVANNYMYAHSHRHVVAWSYTHTQDATTTADAGIPGTDSSTNLPVATYLYWPRPGVKRLSVSATGRSDHASATADITVTWRGGGEKVTGTLPANNTNWGTWPLLNQLLEVPNGRGPHEILVFMNKTNNSYIQGLSIIEVVDRSVNSDYIGGI